MKVKWNIYNEVSNRFLFKIVCFGLYYLFKFIYYIYDLILWDFFSTFDCSFKWSLTDVIYVLLIETCIVFCMEDICFNWYFIRAIAGNMIVHISKVSLRIVDCRVAWPYYILYCLNYNMLRLLRWKRKPSL